MDLGIRGGDTSISWRLEPWTWQGMRRNPGGSRIQSCGQRPQRRGVGGAARLLRERLGVTVTEVVGDVANPSMKRELLASCSPPDIPVTTGYRAGGYDR